MREPTNTKQKDNNMFYTYNQNNSGGVFEIDLEAGIGHFVIIEADSADEADAKAGSIGLYFDGVRKGLDCLCCGDRWYRAWEEPTHTPEVYGQSPSEFVGGVIKHVFVHYADGRVEASKPSK